MFFDQREFHIRCEWGSAGISQFVPHSDAIIIVDVLSFSTCVDIAVSNGATVYPYRWKDASAVAYAQSLAAMVAHFHRQYTTSYSLSPTSLLHILAGTRLVLPSPNGATLSLATGTVPTFTGCLRNAKAIAYTVQKLGTYISVIPAGEQWEDGSLRPALEDLIGAGAIIHHMTGTRSPEAAAAEAIFIHCRTHLRTYLQQCSSGKELRGRGFALDVELAAALDQSECVPVLRDSAYVQYTA